MKTQIVILAAVLKTFLDEQDVSLINDLVHKARSVKTLREICGTFDTSIPTTRSGIDAANQRLNTNRNCIERVDEDEPVELREDAFQSVATVVAATARYTCTRKKIPNCLPDASWRRVADVASQYNNQLVQAASKRLDARYADLEAAANTVEDWLQQKMPTWLNVTKKLKQQMSAQADGRTSAPVYTAPQPDYGRYGTGRRDSSTSAPGMR